MEALAQNSLKQSHLQNSQNMYIAGILFYIMVAYLLYKAYTTVALGQMNLVWSLLSIITGLITGYLLYDEPFNLYTGLSLLFSALALYCAYIADNL